MNLADPTDDAAEVMKDLNLEFFNAQGQFIGFVPMVKMLEDAFKDLTPEQKMAAESALFGAQAVKQMDAILAVGSETLATYTDSLTGTNAAYEQMETQQDTLQGQWTILMGSISLLTQTVGEDMMPVLKNFIKTTLIPMVNGWTSWIEKMGGVRGIVGHALVAIGQYIQGVAEWILSHEYLADGIDALADVFRGLLSFISNVFRGDWSAAWEDIKTIALNAFDAIKNLALAAWEALPIPDSIKDKIEASVRSVGDAVKNAFEWVVDNGDWLIATISGIGAAFLTWKTAQIITAIGSIITKLIAMATAGTLALGPVGWIALLIGAFATLAVRTIQKWDEIKEAGVGQWAGIIGLPTDAQWAAWARQLWQGFLSMLPTDAEWADWGRTILAAIGDAISGIPLLMYDIGKSVASGLVSGLMSAATTVKDAVTGFGSDVLGWFKSIFGIQSPSREMAEVGEDLGDGLVVGILSKGREIEAAGQKILDDLKREQAEAAAEAGEKTGETYVDGVADGINDNADQVDDAVSTVTDTLADGVKELRESLDELESTLGASEEGSYAYAEALRALARFHSNLVDAAEYLENQNIEVSESLKILIEQTKKYADKTEDATDEVDDLTDAEKDAERAAEKFADTLKGQVKRAINTVISGFKSMRQEAQGLQQDLRDVEQAFEDALNDAGERKSEDEADEALRNARNIEDIQEDRRRALADLAQREFDDAEEYQAARSKIEQDFHEDMQDEALRHAREMEDINTDYTRSVEDANEERKDDADQVVKDFEENKTTLLTIFADIKDGIVESFTDSAIDLAIDSLLGKLTGLKVGAETAATGIGTAMSTMAGNVASSASGIVSSLGTVATALAMAAVPFMIGTSDAVADGVASANQWITENIMGQQYGSGLMINGVPYEEAIANDPEIAALYSSNDQVTTKGGDTNIDMRGMYEGADIHVRSDADIKSLAKQNYDLFKSELNGRGLG